MRWASRAVVGRGAWVLALSVHAAACQFGTVGSQAAAGSGDDSTGAGTASGAGPGDTMATSAAATSAASGSATDGTDGHDDPDVTAGTADATSAVDGTSAADTTSGAEDTDTGRPVEASLPTLRWDLECIDGGGCSGDFCPAADVASDQATLTGDPTVVYAVTLSFLGVVEEKRIDGGENDGMWNDGGIPIVDDWNTVSLEISDPPHVYWLNDGAEGVEFTSLLDYDQTVSMRGGATVTLASTDTNQCMTWNHGQSGDPILVPGVPPFPQAHPGQFVQADVVSIVPR